MTGQQQADAALILWRELRLAERTGDAKGAARIEAELGRTLGA